jgi:fucose 4-O-acetylase-like acetyltransferase
VTSQSLASEQQCVSVQPAATAISARRLDLDRAKGLGIILVVIGHIAARTPPKGSGWYVVVRDALYLFHMPFFMYLSGYTFFMTGAARAAPSTWGKLAAKRANRLLLPFLLFGLCFLIGKRIVSKFAYVDNLPDSFIHGLIQLFWYTNESPASSIWYIFVLFVLSVATPPLMFLAGNRKFSLLLITSLLFLVPVPHVMFLDRIRRFFIFFALGGMASDAGERWLYFADKYFKHFILALFAVSAAVEMSGLNTETKWTLLLCGTLSMPALHGLTRSAIFSKSATLLTIGTSSFVLYLLNTPCIGLLKSVMLKLTTWSGAHFLLFAPLLTAAGIFGPMLIKRYVLRHVPVLDRMTI